MRHPARVDEWFPVCTGMTAGSVVVCSVFCSLPLNLALFFLIFVILAHAGIHRIASGVARCYHYVDVLLLGCSMLLPIAVSAFPNAASGACG
ncbi:hypothetical protein ACFD7L_004171 [Vibrio vulnificus]|nr:hypothetical protein [Vibrio vulnificus]EHH0743858.1 hypothetical protein [Vibrio vulnificus]